MLHNLHKIRTHATARDIERQRREWERSIINLGPTNFLTFNFNCPTTVASAHRAMEMLMKKVEWRQNGRNWSKKVCALRLRAIGFMEHPNTNPHWHVACHCPDDWTEALEWAVPFWKKLIPAGQLDARLVHDIAGLASYITKSQTNPGHLDGVFLYSPERKV